MSITLVDSEEKLGIMLASSEAIVFVHFQWSSQSVSSLRVFEDWENTYSSTNQVITQFYRIDPDETRCTWPWLTNNGKDLSGGGYGSVIWVRSGRVVDYVQYAAKEGVELLCAKTKTIFTDNCDPPKSSSEV